MVDEGNPNCDNRFPRSSEWCAICGRYRHADQVKELVAKAPPLSQDQINRISLIFSSTAKDIDWIAATLGSVLRPGLHFSDSTAQVIGEIPFLTVMGLV